MDTFAAIVLAAGKGVRMKSELCKVLHPVAGRPMLLYVVDAVRSCNIRKIALVVGHQAERVRDCIGDCVEYALQSPQAGTGHAVNTTRALFAHHDSDILILCGDTPLIPADTLRKFMEFHVSHGGELSVMTTSLPNPFGYGRILRNTENTVVGIVEEKDATPEQRGISEVNVGIYAVRSSSLFSLLDEVRPNNAQGEYYLTDIIGVATRRSMPVFGFDAADPAVTLGINTRQDLARASMWVWEKKRIQLMEHGVSLLDPSTTYVDGNVVIAADTVVYPGTHILGDTIIGPRCVIEPGVFLLDARLGAGVHVLQGSRIHRAEIQDETSVGPMAHIRPDSVIGPRARIGNFVEVKKSVIGEGSKASHLSYLGDSAIGAGVNIGCGTITCNYDGKKKHPTIIGDHCFVGSDVQFVAPVTVGEGSLIGAGSTITKDVPAKSLAVTRSKQRVYPLRRGQGSETDEDRGR